MHEPTFGRTAANDRFCRSATALQHSQPSTEGLPMPKN